VRTRAATPRTASRVHGARDTGCAVLTATRSPVITLCSRHGRVMRRVVTLAAVGVAILALSACASSSTAAKPQTTVTVTATITVTAPPSSSPASQAAPTPSVTPTSAAPSSPQPARPQVIERFNGSGAQNTQSFTVPDSWHLSWEYWGCSGGTGNFIVEEYNTDGSIDYNGVTVNELGSGRGPVATYAYGDSGSHYLSVNSECSWSLAVVVGGS